MVGRMLLTLMLLFALPLAMTGAMAAVEVTIDRNPVQVNESFQLVFSLDHSPDKDPDFSILQQHFRLLGNNRSTSISIINGKYQRIVKWTLKLMPKQIGEYMLPAIRFDQERSEPFQIKVEPSSLASVPHDQLFIEFEADRQSVPVQGQVILKLRLFSSQNLSAYQFGDVSIKELDAVLEPLGDVRQFQTRIADQSYLVLEKRFALFPQQSGRLEIPPVLAEVRLTSGSAFDPFQTGGRIRRVQSQPITITVESIPQSAAHWLPANRVELREQWQGDLDSLVAGEPITRTLILVADGQTSAQLPQLELAAVDGIKQYPDQPALQNSRSEDGIVGQRVQKVALIPGSPGRYRLPEIKLPWWNLQTRKMELAIIPARDLVVGSAADTGLSGATSLAETSAGAPADGEVHNQFWLWMSLLLACGWALSALYWWLGRRKPGAAQTDISERHSLREASKHLRLACQDNNAATARRALLRWGQALLAPAAVENLHRLGEGLGERLGDSLAADLVVEIDTLNQSLYASGHDAWNGDRLWQLCRQIETDTDRKKSDISDLLSSLNPTA